jgi:hypothetical protein
VVLPACHAQKVHIVREYHRSVRSGDSNLLFIGQAEFAYVLGRENIHASSLQAFNDGGVNAFVGVDFDTSC